ncbi:hypothetical protein QN277_003933 [Acacia crassicarpa]|uniref:CCHC-type domain-containing protein n=1 Tax=Acacia crassicarpa TaxID=499986 RepID=A0AAE1K0D3_9FABA|nr:hypothetical protein QN277_003933 [Acacia crassicarpa]
MEEPVISDPLIWRDEKTEKVLIGKILSSKSYTRATIVRILQKAWNLQSGFEVTEVTGNAFMFSFSEEEEYNRILRGRPWSINGFMLNLMERPKYKLCEEFDFSRCPIWIQIHNVPMEAMCLENAIRIGGYVGEVVLAENPHHNDRFVRNFMRVRVILDLRKVLASGFWMNKPNGGKIWIAIKFEKLQNFCYNCGKIGHDYRVCRLEKLMSVVCSSEPRFGAWSTTNQCRTLDNLIVVVKDSWCEAAYFKKKNEESAVRRRIEREQKTVEDALDEEDDLFIIKLDSSLRKGVPREPKPQETTSSTSEVREDGGVSQIAAQPGSVKNDNMRGVDCDMHKSSPEIISIAKNTAPNVANHQCVGEVTENLLAIVPYSEGPLKEVINGFRGLGLKRSAGEDLKIPNTKRRRLRDEGPKCEINEISVYAENLRKTKARLKRQGKRKARGNKENIPMKLLDSEEMMDVPVSLNTEDQGFVFRAKGGRQMAMKAEGAGGWPLTATKGP